MNASFRALLAAAFSLPLALAALELTPTAPADGATVPLLNARQKTFLDMPRKERVAFFADRENRKELRKNAGYYPLPVKMEWKSDTPCAAYAVALSETPDFTAAVTLRTTDSFAAVENLKMNTRYYWKASALDAAGKVLASTAVRSFVTEDKAPRLLKVLNVPNVRDIGGRKAMNGMRVKQNLVFRTAGMNDNAKTAHVKDFAELLAKKPELKPRYEELLAAIDAVKSGKNTVKKVPYSLKPVWTVFRPAKTTLTDADVNAIAKLDAVPAVFLGATPETAVTNARGRYSFPQPSEGAISIFMQEFDAPSDGEMQVASGADWYWNFRINGTVVFDRMKGNNKNPSTSNYIYNVPVKKGRNFAVVTLLSGSAGWMWCCGERKYVPRVELLQQELESLKRVSVGMEAGKNRLTPEGRKVMLSDIGIKSDIDLRSDGECWGMTGSPLGETVTWFHYSSAAYAGMQAPRGKAAFAKVFRVFLDKKNYPIAFHCIAGQDRTGAVAFILNGLLGVEEEELYLDWEATGFWNPDPGFNHRSRFDHLVSGFNKYPGKTLNERIENYVLSCGFTTADIAWFRAFMLENAPQK